MRDETTKVDETANDDLVHLYVSETKRQEFEVHLYVYESTTVRTLEQYRNIKLWTGTGGKVGHL